MTQYYSVGGMTAGDFSFDNVTTQAVNIDDQSGGLNLTIDLSFIPVDDGRLILMAFYDGLNGTGNRLTGLYTARFSANSTSSNSSSNIDFIQLGRNGIGNSFSTTTNESAYSRIHLCNVHNSYTGRDDSAARDDYIRTLRGSFTTGVYTTAGLQLLDFGWFQHRFTSYTSTFFPKGPKSFVIYTTSGNITGTGKIFYS